MLYEKSQQSFQISEWNITQAKKNQTKSPMNRMEFPSFVWRKHVYN